MTPSRSLAVIWTTCICRWSNSRAFGAESYRASELETGHETAEDDDARARET